MPFTSNRIEAVCGAHANFATTDLVVTVKTELGGKGAMCDGCTFRIDHSTGRIILTDTDKYRGCWEEKAPTADPPKARSQNTNNTK